MKPETKELIKYRLLRARESLEDARLLAENGRLFSAVNRIYYSLFYAAVGLLLTKDLGSSKHSGILGLFNREFVNKGVIEKERGRFYNKMFEFRQKADYKDGMNFSKEEVGLWLNQTQEFVVCVEGVIEGLTIP